MYNRIIKYKAKGKRGGSSEGRWCYGSYFSGAGTHNIIESVTSGGESHFRSTEIELETLCEYSGFHAEPIENAPVDICEGDIIKTTTGHTLVVVFVDGAFRCVTPEEKTWLDKGRHYSFRDYYYAPTLSELVDADSLKVLGNVFDNPELLES